MKTLFTTLLIILCSVILTAQDVYVVGYESNGSNSKAMLWINGVPQDLTDGTTIANATSVFVHNSDVYVAGTVDLTARLWINGVPQTLPDGRYANSVFVSGSDIYVAGTQFHSTTNNNEAVIWKNGVIQHFPGYVDTKITSANSIFVKGSDVYAAGNEISGSYSPARLWKNGIEQNLTDGSNTANAYSVFVDNSDVYVSGFQVYGSPPLNYAKLWKNNNSQDLTDGSDLSARAYSVFIYDGDSYAVGSTYNTQSDAKLWKNGVEEDLTDGSNASVAYSVYVSGGDVYAAGYEEIGSIKIAKLWINGVSQNLSDGTNNAEASAVFVNDGQMGNQNESDFNNKTEIFPNPAENFVNIKSKLPVKSIELYDNSGRRIKSPTSINQSQTKLNLEEIPSGIYYIRIQTEMGWEIQKLVKK